MNIKDTKEWIDIFYKYKDTGRMHFYLKNNMFFGPSVLDFSEFSKEDKARLIELGWCCVPYAFSNIFLSK